MSSLKLAAVASVALALMGVSGAVQAGSSGGTITPYLGYYMYDDVVNYDHHPAYGGALGYQFQSPIQIEANYLLGNTLFSDSDFDIDVEQYYLTAKYHFARYKGSHPYMLIGAGQQRYIVDFVGEFKDSVGVAGVGYEFELSDRMSLTSDFRGLYNYDEETTTAAFMVGFQFRIGGTTVAPAIVTTDPDSDGDGVVDSRDSCPGTLEGVLVDGMGCKVNPDLDGDGVVNELDKCPATSEGAKVDADGCYITITEAKEIQLYVTFDDGSSTVAQESYEEIQRVADFMKEYPLTRVLLAGHTDSTGSSEFNQRLSLERANAVAWLLQEHFGVDGRRVETVGYGEDQPLYPNDTPANRAKNRRVTATVTALVETIQK